ncbi:Uma2 family endonuclease [[Leptolyngbya] sp. PCC 7376]|uniref:Uma2 family endonuclease n=1 Tax=[Leptolyngbya] sp. PCC 7376 TaxID=111781 RepID=UPI0013593971|nr:Uma2 family endonuclease [[Leptolyngbya] sp. PCC 7376]
MTVATNPIPKMTVEEYLIWEEQQDNRYEYIDGEIIAMTGGSIPHNDLAVNLLIALKDHLKPKSCRVNISDVKVQAKANSRYFYPDVVVSCHPEDQQAKKLIQYPTVIIEVLSPSTGKYDTTDKLKYYRQIPSLQEYLLIASDKILVELYQRQPDTEKFWLYSSYGEGETFMVPSIEFECSVDTLYENVTIEPET